MITGQSEHIRKQQLHSGEWAINQLNDKVLNACDSVEYHIPSVSSCALGTIFLVLLLPNYGKMCVCVGGGLGSVFPS